MATWTLGYKNYLNDYEDDGIFSSLAYNVGLPLYLKNLVGELDRSLAQLMKN